MEIKAIETELGIIAGRNAIYLDHLNTGLYPLTLELSGAISRNLCSIQSRPERFIKYRLRFHNVVSYTCCELDNFLQSRYLKSSLNEVQDSELVNQRNLVATHRHYIVATYDHVLEVVASSYEFKILD